MDDKKVILLAFLILIISLISFNLGSGITGNVTTTNTNKMTQIRVDKNSVEEYGLITVKIIPNNKYGVTNDYLSSPVRLYLYQAKPGGDIPKDSFMICKTNRCDKSKVITKVIRIRSNIISDFTPEQKFYFKVFDGDLSKSINVREVKAYFTVINNDRVMPAQHL